MYGIFYLHFAIKKSTNINPASPSNRGLVSVVSVFTSLRRGFVRRHIRGGFATWEWMKSYIKRRDWKLVMCLRAV